MIKILTSKFGQAEGFRKVILLILALLTLMVVALIYYYATAQAERGVYNMTRAFRGFR